MDYQPPARAIAAGLIYLGPPTLHFKPTGGDNSASAQPGATMLFAYLDDGTLTVIADIDEARREFEADDVESGAIRFFDASGNALSPVFPHRSDRKFLGMRVSEDPGPYDLVAADATTEALSIAIAEANVLNPNSWFADLDAVKAHLSARQPNA